MDPKWVLKKAQAYRSAWNQTFGIDPTDHNTILGLAVATSETRCGDAWPGPDGVLNTADDEHNWGATTLRLLNAAEQAAVHAAGIVPTVGKGHAERATAAQAAIVAAGLPLPQGAIHCDSRPPGIPYFVWFATFQDDTQGAKYFIKLLAGTPEKAKLARAVLERETGSEQELATAMRHAGYYTGFHDPKQPGGEQSNIDDYANNLRQLAPGIRRALSGITPRPTLRLGMAVNGVVAWQLVVGAKPDGNFGPKTEALTKTWQAAHGLVADGIVGPMSWSKAEELKLA